MAFGLSMGDVAYVRTHEAAVRMYNKATHWRGEDPDGERPLPGKRHREYGVRMDGTDVVFRYHGTDVVRWHDDGSYTIDTGYFRTPSTCAFVNNFTPGRHWLAKNTSWMQIEDTVYPISGHQFTVSPDGAPHGDGVGEFIRSRINRKRAKELRDAMNYPAYRTWYIIMYPMLQDTMPPQWRRKFVSSSEIKSMLGDPDRWHDLLMSQVGDPKELREALYANWGDDYAIWDYERYDSLPLAELNNVTVREKGWP